jgi:hypothetical protein
MSNEQYVHPGADMEGFVRELMEFVELGDIDATLIRHSAPVVLVKPSLNIDGRN